LPIGRPGCKAYGMCASPHSDDCGIRVRIASTFRLLARAESRSKHGSLIGSVAPWLLIRINYSVTPLRPATPVLAPETRYRLNSDNGFCHDDRLRDPVVNDGDRWRISDHDPRCLRARAACQLLSASRELWESTRGPLEARHAFDEIVAAAIVQGLVV
jgi:hypothetical protein